MSNTYQLFCDFCGWKRIVNDEKDTTDLYEMNQSKVQKHIPQLGDALKPKEELEKQQWTCLKRKFRCPTCGRYATPRSIPDTQKNLEEKIESAKRVEDRKKNEENWFIGRKTGPKGW